MKNLIGFLLAISFSISCFSQSVEINSAIRVGSVLTEGSNDQVIIKAELSEANDSIVSIPISLSNHFQDFEFDYNGYLDVSTFDTLKNAYLNDFHVSNSDTIYLVSNSSIFKLSPDGNTSFFVGDCCDLVDGTGSDVRFSSITAITTDSDGNLIVVDNGNHAIRKVTPSGVVTTIAGNGSSGFEDGTSEEAIFNNPADAAVDASGNIYVTDYNNFRIRKIDVDGNVSTIAGDGEYGFADGSLGASKIGYVYNISVDDVGNVYFFDNGFIRIINSDGYLNTVYGNGSYEYTADGDATSLGLGDVTEFEFLNGTFYFYSNNQIRKITNKGELVTIAGDGTFGLEDGSSTEAQFKQVKALKIDSAGDLICLDYGDNDDFFRRISLSPKINISIGSLADSIIFSVVDDEVFLENEEQVDITLLEPLNAKFGVDVETIFDFVIIDNDTNLPEITFENESLLFENDDDSLIVTASLSNLVGVDVQVDFQFGGSSILNTDYQVSADSILIEAGKLSGSIFISAIQDSDVEIIEDIIISIDSIHNAYADTLQLAINFADDDFPTIASISNLGNTTTEGNSDSIKLIATLNTPSSFDTEILLNSSPEEFGGDFTYHYPGINVVSTLSENLEGPRGIAVDSKGNVFIANSGENTIVKIDLELNQSIYAGEQYTSGTTDSEDPLLARFWSPTSIAIDEQDNLYIADHNNHTIRKISVSGEVSTLAGNPGVSDDIDGTGAAAHFNNPRGITYSNDLLFVADKGNSKIKVVTLEGLVTTYAGTGEQGFKNGIKEEAQFNKPANVVVMKDGSVIVADKQNDYLRKIDLDGQVTTYSEYFYRIHGLAISPKGELFVTSTANFAEYNYLFKLVDGVFEQVAGGEGFADGAFEDARFRAMSDLTFDKKGSIYIVDFGNNAIRKIENGLKINIKAGETEGTLSLAAIDDEVLLEEDEIVSIEVDKVVNAVYDENTFDVFDFTIVDNDNSLPVVTLSYETLLYENDQDSLIIEASLGNIAGVDVQINFSIDGSASIDTDYEITSDSITIKAGESRGVVYLKPLQDSAVEIIESIVFSVDTVYNGNLDLETFSIALIDEDEPEVTSIVQSGSEVVEGGLQEIQLEATLSAPASFDVNVFLTTDSQEHVADFDFTYPGKGYVVTIDSSELDGPRGIAVDSNGSIYIANSGQETIVKIDLDGVRSIFAGAKYDAGIVDAQEASEARFNKPSSLAFDDDDNLYVADHNNHSIRKITPEGVVSTLAGVSGTSGDQDGAATTALFNQPRGIIFHEGALYVADKNNNKIRKVTLDGVVSTLAGTGTEGASDGSSDVAEFNSPANLIALADGSLIVADKRNAVLRKIDPEGNVSTYSEYLYNLHGLAISRNGDLIVSTTSFGDLYRLEGRAFERITTGEGYVDGAIENAKFGAINDLTIDQTGSILLVDFGNNAIRKLDNALKIVVQAGESTGTTSVSAINDNEVEETEEVTLTISTVDRANYSDQSFSFNIIDDEFTFSEVDSSLPGLTNASIGWADFDRDGDKDVAMMGNSNTEGRVLRIYRNDEATFTDSNQNLVNMSDGDLAWVDINNDGYVDLASMGISSSGIEFIIYLNEEGISFTPLEDHGIEALGDGKMEWGDFDNDGLKDLVITGLNASNNLVADLYRNVDGQGLFMKDDEFDRSGVLNGDIKIFDLDSDGDNDLFFTGNDISDNVTGSFVRNTLFDVENIDNSYYYFDDYLKESSIEFVNQDSLMLFMIGENRDGDPDFRVLSYANSMYDLFQTNYELEELLSDSSSVKNGDIAIADANNDGDFDILITGEDADGSPQTVVWFSYEGKYEIKNFGIRDLRNSSADWIDFDNDGDLDVFISGIDQNGNVSLLYENNLISERANEKPERPNDLTLVDLGNGNVRFEWEKPFDDYSSSLGYNLRIGTAIGEAQILNPSSDLVTGEILIQENPLTDNLFYETNLDPGTYYWSVQSVDGGYLASEFAVEQSFTVLYEWKELNLGGIVDRRIPGSSNAQLNFFDVDFDSDFDILYAREDNQVELLINNSNNFRKLYLDIYDRVSDAVIGDLNGDGLNDLVFALSNGSNYSNTILFGRDTIRDDNGFQSYDYFDYYYDNDYGLANARMQILDINNDGKNELVIAGATTEFSSGIPKLYVLGYEKESNVTSQTYFVDLSDQISPLSNAVFDFGDVDNDQDIDFVISGFDADEGIKSELYLNETAGESVEDVLFEITSDELVATVDGTVDMIDFDSDGDLDLIFTGSSRSGSDVFELYENRLEEGSISFVNVTVGLDGIRESKIDLGDFNGDGFSDLLYSGLIEGSGQVTRLSEFDPSTKKYVASDFDVSNIINAEVEFGDFDGDGDLDFMLTGEEADQDDRFVFDIYLNVRNESALAFDASQEEPPTSIQFSGSSENFIQNQPPSPPSEVNDPEIEIISEGLYEVNLSWNAGTDDFTPEDGLSYALKIGSEPGKEDIMNSGSNQSGFRIIPGKGNTEHNRGWKVILPEGAFYWEVQSIDASYNGSEFLNGGSFILGDIENQAPVASDQMFEFEENPALDYEIGVIEASDPEEERLTYEIISGNEDGAFALIDSTGLLTVSNSVYFDYETITSFDLNVLITDNEAAEINIVVTINLIDVDESTNLPPTIEDQFFEVNENTEEGTLIGSIVYEDEDCCDVILRVLEESVEDAFQVGTSGEIYVANATLLDFEVNTQFTLEVEVNDLNGGLDTAQVVINVLDIDENVLSNQLDIIELSIYPNPASEYLNVKTEVLENLGSEFSIIDMSGRLILKNRLRMSNQRIDISELRNGMYIFRFKEHSIPFMKK